MQEHSLLVCAVPLTSIGLKITQIVCQANLRLVFKDFESGFNDSAAKRKSGQQKITLAALDSLPWCPQLFIFLNYVKRAQHATVKRRGDPCCFFSVFLIDPQDEPQNFS